MLVRHVGTQEVYAMKVLKKKHLKEEGQVAHSRAERNVLEHVQHPFIVALKASFQVRVLSMFF